MKMFLISDNVDTQTGMRLAGVEGVVVHEREELYDTLQKTLADKEIGIILLTEKFGKEFPDILEDVRLNHKLPLLIEIPDRHGKALRSAQQGRIVGERVLRLRHADRQIPEAQFRQLRGLLLGVGGQRDTVSMVHTLANRLQFFLDGSLQRVGKPKLIGLLTQTDDFLGQRLAALAALGPNLGQRHIDAKFTAFLLHQF